MNCIETERLILRTWRETDTDDYWQINQDQRVLEFLLGPISMDKAKQFIIDMNQCFVENRYCNWAVEEKLTGKLIGYVGLQKPLWNAHFTPCITIEWRLGSKYWGKGYATEGAKAVLEYAFDFLGLNEVVSFTVPVNQRSIRVMEKLGMKKVIGGDFVHPRVPENHPLSNHVLYAIYRESKN